MGFQLCGLSVVCGLCRASILAGLAGMQGYASPLRSPGPSFPAAWRHPVVRPDSDRQLLAHPPVSAEPAGG
uniref:DUF1472 domain-containing protein n=1 Tax=Escherichia coli TaxID=562 RepID=A0A890DH27_ECOLX|nr:hypothetical protein [Escherichia coli]